MPVHLLCSVVYPIKMVTESHFNTGILFIPVVYFVCKITLAINYPLSASMYILSMLEMNKLYIKHMYLRIVHCFHCKMAL